MDLEGVTLALTPMARAGLNATGTLKRLDQTKLDDLTAKAVRDSIQELEALWSYSGKIDD